MEIELDTAKTASQNAGDLFNRAKKLEDKAKKAESALKTIEERISRLKKTGRLEAAERKGLKEKKPAGQWYEKFRWFFSSSGKLIVGGRDATTNDILMKKHVAKNEPVFHADIVGAPFFAIKRAPGRGAGGAGEEIGESDIREAAQAAAVFSRAWKLGYGSLSVYYAPRERFTKQAPSGEYVKKGAFMVYGKKDWIAVELKAAVGVKNGKVTAGPISAIEKWAERSLRIEPGHLKQGEATKLIAKKLKAPADEVQRALPAGRTQLIKTK